MPARLPRQRGETGAAWPVRCGKVAFYMKFLCGSLGVPLEFLCVSRQLCAGFGRLAPYHGRWFLIGYLMCPATGLRKEQSMLDAILLALGFGFFALSIAYAYGCDRL